MEIRRNDGLPQSRFCCMTKSGIIEIRDRPDSWPYQINASAVDRMNCFAEWIAHLTVKLWFTPEVCADFTGFVCLLKHGSPDEWAEWVKQSASQ